MDITWFKHINRGKNPRQFTKNSLSTYIMIKKNYNPTQNGGCRKMDLLTCENMLGLKTFIWLLYLYQWVIKSYIATNIVYTSPLDHLEQVRSNAIFSVWNGGCTRLRNYHILDLDILYEIER